MRHFKFASFLLSLLLGVGAPFAALAADSGMLKMRFVQSGNTASSWPLYVAEQKKFFAKNGLQVEVIIVRGATNTTRAVLSGTIPIGRINPDYVIGAIDKGAKVKIISANMGKIPYDIFARPEIKTGAELKGKTIGVSTLTGGTTLMFQEVMEKAYKLKENDYKLLVVGTSPDRYAALKGGSVQATFMGPPFNFRAVKDGFTKLANWHEYLGPVLFTADFAEMNYIKSHRSEIVRYLESIVEATRWLYDPKNKEEALKIHQKALKSTSNIAEQDYKYLVEDFKPFPKDARISEVAFNKTMELRVKDGFYKGKKVPPMSEYVDTSLLDEAIKLAGAH